MIRIPDAVRSVLGDHLWRDRRGPFAQTDQSGVTMRYRPTSRGGIVTFVGYYKHKRYHMALGNVTPDNMLNGSRELILRRMKEVHCRQSNGADPTTEPS